MGSRPEDFMDEEDLEALREGRGALGSTQMYGPEQPVQAGRDPLMDMLGLGGTERAVKDTDSSTSSIQVSSSSIGTRLLQRMGWRPGHGLGPRVSFKRRNELLAMLGKPVPTDELQDEEAEKHMWPPPDTPMPAFSTKQDAKGLGWAGTGINHTVSLDEALKRARAETGSKGGGGEKTEGFGLGALEEDSDGEDDVYAVGNRRRESTLASRHTQKWASDSDRIVLGGKIEVEETRPELQRAKVQSSDNVWHDGRAVIAGFRIASKSIHKEVWYEAPNVPKGWEPDPQQVWSKASTEKAKSQPRVNISSADRASILGEARLPGPPPSIKDYLSQKDQERLQREAEGAKQVAAGATPALAAESKLSMEIPRLDAAVAKSALQGYIPFASEPDKQERYRVYISSQAHPSDVASALKPSSHQNHQQFIAELNDFAKSASIFKPLSTVMASRFQSSVSGSSEMPQIHPGLHKPEPKVALTQGQEEQRKKDDEDEKRKEEMQTMTLLQRNARMGLFGKETTREVKVWKPNRLLCKRFNVPMPYAEEEEAKSADREDDVMAAFGASKIKQMDMPKVNARWEESKKQLQQLAAQRSVEDDRSRITAQSGSEAVDHESDKGEAKGENRSGVVDVNNIGLGEVQDKDEGAGFVKPSMDIFKAVFADDDSDEDEEEVAEEEAGKSATDATGPSEENTKQAQSRETAIEEKTVTDLRPTFVPRKRRTEEPNGEKGDKKKKESKKKSLLTFSVDEEEEPIRLSKATAAPAPSKASRPRAADLFS